MDGHWMGHVWMDFSFSWSWGWWLSVHANSVIWLSFTPVLKQQVQDNSMMILLQNSYPPEVFRQVTIFIETVLASLSQILLQNYNVTVSNQIRFGHVFSVLLNCFPSWHILLTVITIAGVNPELSTIYFSSY